MLNTLFSFCTCFALLMGSTAFANESKIQSSVSVTRVSGEKSRFIFQICGPIVDNCELIGRETGYSQAEVETLSGRWKQARAIGTGAVVAAVGAYVGAFVGAIGAGTALTAWGTGTLGTTAAIASYGVSTVAVPAGTMVFIDELNPVKLHREGRAERRMIRGVRQSVRAEENNISMVIFTDSENQDVIDFARVVEEVLWSLEE